MAASEKPWHQRKQWRRGAISASNNESSGNSCGGNGGGESKQLAGSQRPSQMAAAAMAWLRNQAAAAKWPAGAALAIISQ